MKNTTTETRSSKRTKLAPCIVFVLLASLLLLTACGEASDKIIAPTEDGISAIENNAEVPSQTLVPEIPDDYDGIIATSMPMLETYDLAEMVKHSSLIARVKITEILPSKKVKMVGVDGEKIVTDVLAEALETVRGAVTSPFKIRFNGGYYEGSYDLHNDTPNLALNEECVVFLYQPNMGEASADECYYPTGSIQGVFRMPTAEEKNIVLSQSFAANTEELEAQDIFLPAQSLKGRDNSATTKQNEGSEEILQRDWVGLSESFDKIINTDSYSLVLTWEQLEAVSKDFNVLYPIDEGIHRREAEEAYKINLANGAITQDEYDKWISELDKYATEAD